MNIKHFAIIALTASSSFYNKATEAQELEILTKRWQTDLSLATQFYEFSNKHVSSITFKPVETCPFPLYKPLLAHEHISAAEKQMLELKQELQNARDNGAIKVIVCDFITKIPNPEFKNVKIIGMGVRIPSHLPIHLETLWSYLDLITTVVKDVKPVILTLQDPEERILRFIKMVHPSGTAITYPGPRKGFVCIPGYFSEEKAILLYREFVKLGL